MSISDNIQSIKKELPNNVTLIAVSKTKSDRKSERFLEAMRMGLIFPPNLLLI